MKGLFETLFVLSLVASLGASQATRVIIPERYSMGNTNLDRMQAIDEAAWIWKGSEPNGTIFLLFQKTFSSDGKPCRIHVSADERFVLSLDGKRIARGPDRGTVERWTYKTYDLQLEPGSHTLEAVTWRLGNCAPVAQLSWHKTGGFILKAEGAYDSVLTTGKTEWRVARLPHINWNCSMSGGAFGVGCPLAITGNSPLFARPEEKNFTPAVVVREPVRANKYGVVCPGWRLYPSSLPDQLDRLCKPGSFRAAVNSLDDNTFFQAKDASHPACKVWNELLQNGTAVTIAPNTEICLLWNLGNYYCAYPEMQMEGGKGATVDWGWAESLYGKNRAKGDRDAFEEKKFHGFVDTIRPTGGTCGFALPWWRPGKWCRIRVKTADEPLTVKSIALYETHYPTPIASSFVCDDASLSGVQKICERGMEMCSHEMGFDCPYYEQQMYPGDTRIQLLIQGVLFNDDRLIRRDIELFDFSHREDGRIGMNFPTRGTQESWTYSMIWPIMLGDYARWHNNAAWLKARLPGLRHTMGGLKFYENEEGLLDTLCGWNFMDWVPGWDTGIAPDGNKVSSINNLFYVYALKDAALIERLVGDPEFSTVYEKMAKDRAEKIIRRFWNESRGMLADNIAGDRFSEHAQSLALLLDILPGDKAERVKKGLLEEKKLARCTVYFSHYLFDSYAKIGRTDLILQRLDLWRDYVKDNMCTPLESPGNARSDCHAWGSHPLYHLHANIAGIKPAEPFFASVRIAPQPGGLKKIHARTPHPKGMIEVNFSFDREAVSGTVTLPPGVSGIFVWKGKETPLRGGSQSIQQ